MSEHLFDNNEAASLARLSTQLRVLIDLRHRMRSNKTGVKNIVNLKSHHLEKQINDLIQQHQKLLKPSSRYFSKYGEKVSIYDYKALSEFLLKFEKAGAGK